MTTINVTEIKFDQLEKATGGSTNAVGPVNYPYLKTGPIATGSIDKHIGLTDSCDPAIMLQPKKAGQSVRV